MADFLAEIESASHDPLVVALVLLLLGALIARVPFRRRPVSRAITRLLFFVLLTVTLLGDRVVPYQPMRPSGSAFDDTIGAIVRIGWWMWAAWNLVGFTRAFVILENRPREGKLLQEIIVGLVHLAAVFAIVAYVFDLPVQGLLATSGAIAIIIGLALQSSLSDVFSGLVLSVSRPYLPDDFVRIEGGTEGRIIELNWRATHILTPLKELAIVPNSVIAKAKIVNVSSASHIHGVNLSVKLEATARPSVGIRTLRHAMLNSQSIVLEPAPTVRIKSIAGDCIENELTFFVFDYSLAAEVKNELVDLIFRHLLAAGLRLASPQNPPPQSASEEAPTSRVEQLLKLVAVFEALTDEERSAIAKKLKRNFHRENEVLFQPGTLLQSLYIVATGVVSVEMTDGETAVEVFRLGPGDHFGTISLLTGTASNERATSLTESVTYELSKADLRVLMAARPQVELELSHVLALRQAVGRTVDSTDQDESKSTPNLSARVAKRLRKLFDLGAG